MTLDCHDLVRATRRLAAATAAAKDTLNAQDGKLGDGDLGITLANGWAEADSAELPTDDLGRAFMVLSKAFQRVSASSYGTLLATGLMAAARAAKGRESIEMTEISGLLAAARDAMMARGRGELGQKSVLDVLDALAAATADLAEREEIARAARISVDRTLEGFRQRPAGLGRARMYGDASIGLDDPGMLAVKIMLDGLMA
ncbi:MAG: DAK2 domain-containing protein [Rhodobacteraceae bacterium]|nr:DAK2 domain-containing protein [Paracoccaceae bacterium]